jgi:hypothetical protein
MRPILMTSFTFITGVMPLVFATGAGASARRSIGITVFWSMLASTCLAVIRAGVLRGDARRGGMAQRQAPARCSGGEAELQFQKQR